VACGIDKIQVVQGYDVGGTSQIATSVAANKPKAKDGAPVAPGSPDAIAAAAPAPEEVKGVATAAPPLKKADSATLVELPPPPKQEDAYPSKVASQAARAKAVTAPVQVSDADTEAFRNARPKVSGVSPVGPGSTGAIVAAAPAPKDFRGVVVTAPPVKKGESTKLVELPPAPKQEDAYPSTGAPQAARAKAVTAPVQVPDTDTEAFRTARPKVSGVAAVAPGRTGAIVAAAPAPKDFKSVVVTAPPVKKVESTALLELPAAPKQEDAYPSKVATQTARAKAVTAPVQVPEPGTEAFRNARPQGARVAAVSGDQSIAVESRTKPLDNKSTPTNAPISSVVTGTFGGQVFGSSGADSFSAGLILTLEEAGKELKGTWIAERGKSGILTGTLAGSKIATLRLKQLEPCAGSYDGVIVEDGSRLRGSYSGTDCKGQVDAVFNVAKR